MSPETLKTTLSGHSVDWVDGDVVSSVSYSKELGLYDVRKGLAVTNISGPRAQVKISALADYAPAVLLYPGDDSMGWNTEDATVIAEIPSTLEPSPGSFPSVSNLSFGKIAADGKVKMKNALALLKFTIESDDIASVEFSGNDGEVVSGNVTFDPESMEVLSADGALIQTLAVKDGGFTPGTYYLPVIPQTFEKGISLKLVKTNGDVARKSSENVATILRNKVVDLGTESEWGLIFVNASKKISVVFSDGSAALWPFSPAMPKQADIKAAGGEPMGPFVMSGSPEYPFYLRIQEYVQTESCRLTAGAGFRFGGTAHDYLLLPAIPGYALVSVAVTCGTQATTIAITDNPAFGNPVPVDGGKAKTIAKASSAEFILTGTEPGVSYRIDNPGTKVFTGILNFVLTYELF